MSRVFSVPRRDKKELSKIGFDIGRQIGAGNFGQVFNGVCNKNAVKGYVIGNNDATQNPAGCEFDNENMLWRRKLSLDGKTCAIKHMDDYDENLANEVKVLMDLFHPNVAEAYGSLAINENCFYLVMEYCNGGDLKTFLESYERNKNLTESNSLEIVRQLTDGLHYLHRNNVVHGDIQTRNIMLTNGVLWKYVDFGNMLTSGDLSTPFKNDIKDLGLVFYQIFSVTNIQSSDAIEKHINSIVKQMTQKQVVNMNAVMDFVYRLFSLIEHCIDIFE